VKLPDVRSLRSILRLAAPLALTTWACSSVDAPASAADAGATDVDAEVPVDGEVPVDAPPDVDPLADATAPEGGSEGCLKPAKAGVFEGLAIDVLGASRTYTLSVPVGYDPRKAYRLVFGFHSGGRTGASARPYFDLEGRSGGAAIFVYPDGVRGNWDLNTAYADNRDVALFDALVASLRGAYCLDKARTFAMGTSNGAYFVNQLACARGNVLRGIASHAGGGPYMLNGGTYDEKGQLRCPTPPVAAAIFHGLADTNVSPTEGDKAIAHWSHWNGCQAARNPVSPAPCEAPSGCASPVLVCKVPDQGHAIWGPGRQATWDFFAKL
jgi:polyhydroxybutyrate depolymerase